MIDPDQMNLLTQARDKSRRLFEELCKQQIDLDANPPRISEDQLMQGRAALLKAINAARRTLENLEAALALAENSE